MAFFSGSLMAHEGETVWDLKCVFGGGLRLKKGPMMAERLEPEGMGSEQRGERPQI